LTTVLNLLLRRFLRGLKAGALPTSLQMYQTTLQGSDDGLSAVFHIQSLQDRADMTLYGCLGDAEQAGDLLIAVATRHQLQNFLLAGT